ncbi:MAG TPA: CcmD family protein [Bacteroidota bacterium]
MYEFLAQNPLYVVLSIVLICWFGIGLYLVRLGRKISILEQRMQS